MDPTKNPAGDNWWHQPRDSSGSNIQEGEPCNQTAARPEPALTVPASLCNTGGPTPKLALTDSQLLWLKEKMSGGGKTSPSGASPRTPSPRAATAVPGAAGQVGDVPPAHMKGMLAAREHILQQLGIGRGSLKRPSDDHCRSVKAGIPGSHTAQPVQAWQSPAPSQPNHPDESIYAAYVEGMYDGHGAAGGYADPRDARLQKPHNCPKSKGRKSGQTAPNLHREQVQDTRQAQQDTHDVKILGMESYQKYVKNKAEVAPKKQLPWRDIKAERDRKNVEKDIEVPGITTSLVMGRDTRKKQTEGMGEGGSQKSKYLSQNERALNGEKQNSPTCADSHMTVTRQGKKVPSKETKRQLPVAKNGDVAQVQVSPSPQGNVSSKPSSRRNSLSDVRQGDTARESTEVIKAEYDWRRFQLERKFKKVLDSLKVGGEEMAAKELWNIIKSDGGRLEEFPMPGAEAVLLQLLLAQAVEREDFRLTAVKVLAAGCNLYQASMESLSTVLLQKQASYCKVSGATNAKRLCAGYSKTLGHLYLLARSSLSGQQFLDCISDVMFKTLETWLHFNTQQEKLMEVCTDCLCALLRVVGAELDSSGRELMQLHFSVIKDKILDAHLPRVVRSSLLDLALLRAGGWVEQGSAQEETTQDKDGSSSIASEEADTVVESSPTTEHRTEPDTTPAPPTTNGDIPASSPPQELPVEKDQYKAVRAMLHDLTLQEFFPKFKDNGIRDATLQANRGELKSVLKESGFLPGTILEIMLYLDTHGVGAKTGQHAESASCKSKEQLHIKPTQPVLPSLKTAAQQSLPTTVPGRSGLETRECGETTGSKNNLKVDPKGNKAHKKSSKDNNNCGKSGSTNKGRQHKEPKRASKASTEQSPTVSNKRDTSVEDGATKCNESKDKSKTQQCTFGKKTLGSSVCNDESKDDGKYAAKTLPLPCPSSLPLPPRTFFKSVPGEDTHRADVCSDVDNSKHMAKP